MDGEKRLKIRWKVRKSRSLVHFNGDIEEKKILMILWKQNIYFKVLAPMTEKMVGNLAQKNFDKGEIVMTKKALTQFFGRISVSWKC